VPKGPATARPGRAPGFLKRRRRLWPLLRVGPGPRRSAGGSIGFGDDLVGVGAESRRWTGMDADGGACRSPGRLADRTNVGVVHLDHTRRHEQRFEQGSSGSAQSAQESQPQRQRTHSSEGYLATAWQADPGRSAGPPMSSGRVLTRIGRLLGAVDSLRPPSSRCQPRSG